MNDCDTWFKFPQHRKWFNKLYVAETFNYNCGPCGVKPNKSGKYVVRPIYNLSGMGLGARVEYIEAGGLSKVPVGHFWCEYIEGNQYSVTYTYENGHWKLNSSFIGINKEDNLSKFSIWKRSNFYPEFPDKITGLEDVGLVNIEFKGDNPIEVHLRGSPDPDYDIFVPIWEGEDFRIEELEKEEYSFVESFEDADGFLDVPRIGFMVKNYEK